MTSLLQAAHTCDEHSEKYPALLAIGDDDDDDAKNKSKNVKNMFSLFEV